MIVIAQPQKPAVNTGMQRLHAPVHHFGKARHVRHVLDGQACLAQRLGAAAGGQKLHPATGEGLSQFDQSGLVGNGKKGSAHGGEIGHGQRILGSGLLWSVFFGHGLQHVLLEVADADRRFLCLGQ